MYDPEFDHTFTVHADGSVTDSAEYAPTLCDDGLDDPRWRLVSHGLTGQYGYSGPILHNSEQWEGGVADRFLSEPGTYVLLVSHYSPEDPDSDESIAEGWAVAQLVSLED